MHKVTDTKSIIRLLSENLRKSPNRESRDALRAVAGTEHESDAAHLAALIDAYIELGEHMVITGRNELLVDNI